ncbi:hypothetical protein Tco_0150842 [Tanacetum coccineum]
MSCSKCCLGRAWLPLGKLNGVHDTFHVSNLKKCLADPTLQVPLDEIQADTKLNFVEEPMEILEREFKKIKRSRIAIVKVWWNSKRGPEFTWEREDQMRLKFKYGSSLKTSPLLYPELCHILFEKCSASGSIRRPISERMLSSQNFGVKLVEMVLLKNQMSHAVGEIKKSKKDSELGELEETTKSEIANIIAQENQGPTMEECHEKLKRMRLEPDDLIYLAALGIFCQSKSYREACKGLSDDFFAQYDQSDIHVNEDVHDDNDGDVEVVQPTGSEADQQYMVNLQDDIATQIMQARS